MKEMKVPYSVYIYIDTYTDKVRNEYYKLNKFEMFHKKFKCFSRNWNLLSIKNNNFKLLIKTISKNKCF